MKPLPLAALRGLAVGAFMALVVVVPSTQNAQAISPIPWLNNSVFAPVPGLGNLNDGLYLDATKGSLVPERGPTFSNVRAGVSSTVDNEGLVRTIQSGEARFWKLRRVENLYTGSTVDLTNAAWNKQANVTVTANAGTDPLGGSAATRYQTSGANGSTFQTVAPGGNDAVVSFYVKSNTGSNQTFRLFQESGAGADVSGDLTATTAWRRFSFFRSVARSGNFQGIAKDSGGTDVDLLVWGAQFEHVTGQSITAPSEYVSKGVLSSPWHGAGVDGVRYFNTANGNTVASNVVTEATGAPLTVTSSGIWPNGAHTNICLQSESLGTAPWANGGASTPTLVAANVRLGDLVMDLLGDDSAVLAAYKEQALTFTGDGVKAASLHMKAGTSVNSVVRIFDGTALANRLDMSIAWSGGVPTVTVTTGTHIATETLANGVYRILYTTTAVTAANANAIRLYPASNAALDVTATGTVNIGGVQVVNESQNGRYVKTTTASVAVPADSITASGSTVVNQVEGTAWVQAIGPVDTTAIRGLFSIDDGTANERVSLIRDASSKGTLEIVDGAVAQATVASVANWAASASKKLSGAYKLNDSNNSFDGTAGTADTVCTMPTTTTLRLGTTTDAPNAPIQKVALSRVRASDANQNLATAP